MTNAIVKENKVSFKTLEQKIFEEVCELARERTKKILEDYDDVLSKHRDTSKYRNKGKRITSEEELDVKKMKAGLTGIGKSEFFLRKWMEYGFQCREETINAWVKRR